MPTRTARWESGACGGQRHEPPPSRTRTNLRRRLEGARRGGHRAARARLWRPASSWTSRGPHGWEYSATNLGRVSAPSRPPAQGVAGLQRRVLPLVEVRADFASVARGDSRRRPRRRRRRLGAARRRPHARSPCRRTSPCSTAGRARIEGITEATPHDKIPLGEDTGRVPQRGVRCCRAAAVGRRQRPVRPGAGPRAVHGSWLETGRGRRLPAARPPAQDPRRAAGVGARGEGGGRRVSLRGGDFLYESGQDLSIGYDSHDAGRRAACTWSRASASTSPRPRRRSRSRSRAWGEKRRYMTRFSPHLGAQLHGDHELARVLALEQLEQSVREGLDAALDDVLA